mgnify:CR=1 FL=1
MMQDDKHEQVSRLHGTLQVACRCGSRGMQVGCETGGRVVKGHGLVCVVGQVNGDSSAADALV